MPTLAQTLGTTTPVSPLLRKARRLGIANVADMISLAASRGCFHYRQDHQNPPVIACDQLTNEELVTLLLIGENSYEPTAIRCAGQLARSPDVDPGRLARLTILEKTGRVLSHIVRHGIEHDPDGKPFWQDLLARLPEFPARPEPALPHWSRFVSMPGIQRSGPIPVRWLIPAT